MAHNLDDIMSKKSDKDLIKIVTIDRDSNGPLAVAAAELELSKRKLNPNEYKEIQDVDLIEDISERKEEMDLAGKGLRFLNLIIDFFVVIISWVFLIFVLSVFDPTLTSSENETGTYFYFYFTYFLYYYLMERYYRKTIGKFLTKTHVINVNNEFPTSKEIFIRSISRIIPFDVLTYLFTLKGLHDYLSKTRVVKDVTKSKTAS